MHCMEHGVSPNSDYYFCTPSSLAQQLFFYLLCAGEFYCTDAYFVNRKSYNSFLCIYLLDGSCQVEQDGFVSVANAGDIILLNCYRPHTYHALSPLHFLFFHFDGSTSPAFFDCICKARGNVFPVEYADTLQQKIASLLEAFRFGTPLPEHDISCQIQEILCNLLSPVQNQEAAYSPPIEKALCYIKKRLSEDLTLESISRHVNLSPYHFSRLFKSETGTPPYDYLLRCRIDYAKKLLKQSQKSIKEIAFETGFHSESNFTTLFRQKTGLAPNQFRKLPF
jgi:AraC family transcriptional regulator